MSVIIFYIRSVEKTYPYTKKKKKRKILANDCLFAVVSVCLFRNDINQVVDNISFD